MINKYVMNKAIKSMEHEANKEVVTSRISKNQNGGYVKEIVYVPVVVEQYVDEDNQRIACVTNYNLSQHYRSELAKFEEIKNKRVAEWEKIDLTLNDYYIGVDWSSDTSK